MIAKDKKLLKPYLTLDQLKLIEGSEKALLETHPSVESHCSGKIEFTFEGEHLVRLPKSRYGEVEHYTKITRVEFHMIPGIGFVLQTFESKLI